MCNDKNGRIEVLFADAGLCSACFQQALFHVSWIENHSEDGSERSRSEDL